MRSVVSWRYLAGLLCFWIGASSRVVAQDVGSVIVLPNEPFVIPVLNHDYRFPDYRAGEVLTQRNDNNRTGASYTPGVNQNSVQTFRKLGEFRVGGVVLAQPLYARSATVRNIRQPVLVIATSTNEIYAFSPSERATGWLWHALLGPPLVSNVGNGAKCDPSALAAWQQWETLEQGKPNGLIGIESTPVIDTANNQVLVSFKTEEGFQRLAALDLNDGRIKKSVIVPAPNRDWHKLHRNRASLLLADGVVYLAFSSLCEGNQERMHGSISAFDARTLDPAGRRYEVTDAGMDGGGIWQGSTGLAADTRGNVYFTTGNRRCMASELPTIDAPNLANSVIRLKTRRLPPRNTPRRPGDPYMSMQVEDFFTPYRRVMADCYDLDLSAAGVLLIPGSNLLATGGKEGIVYVLDRSDMGHYDNAGAQWNFASLDSSHRGQRHTDNLDDPKRDRVHQKFQATADRHGGESYLLSEWMRWPHIHGTPAFATFGVEQAFMFLWGEKDRPKRFQWLQGKFDPRPLEGWPIAAPYVNDKLNGMPGGMLSVNVDPTASGRGVLFASVKACGEPKYPACDRDQEFGILRAYDPFTMRQVWSNAGELYWFARLVPPTVANGRVFLPTASGKVLIYGDPSHS